MIEQLNKLLRRYRVSFAMRQSSTYGTSISTPYFSVAVTAENDGRKLTGDAWGDSEAQALEDAFAKLIRQIEALDGLE